MDTKKENVLTTSPNPSESPDSSHELAVVLSKIAEIEARPGFEGPKITLALRLDDPIPSRGKIFEDIVVGEIARACDAREWDFISEICHTGEIVLYLALISQVEGEELRFVVHEQGDSLALAAASAYLEARMSH